MTPIVRRTWAPRGQPPVLVHPFGWRRASMGAAICPRVGGGGARVGFDIRPGSYNTETLIEVLGGLHRILDGDKVTVVVNPLKSGEFGGIFVSITLADGRTLGGNATN